MTNNNQRKQLYCMKSHHTKISKLSFNSKETPNEFTMQEFVDAIMNYVFDEKHPERVKEITATMVKK